MNSGMITVGTTWTTTNLTSSIPSPDINTAFPFSMQTSLWNQMTSSKSTLANRASKSGGQTRITLDDLLSQYWEYTTAHNLCLYGYPSILILGTVGNLLTLAVMINSGMRRRSTGFYMSALSVFDTSVLYTSCFRQWLSLLNDSEVLSLSNASCKTFNFLSYTFFDIAVWLLIVMTCERYLVVQFPLLSPKVASLHIARAAIIVLILVMCALNLHFFWTVSLDSNEHCKYTEDSSHFHDDVWPWIDATVYSFLPFIILLVFNILIIVVHRKATILRKTTVRVHRSEITNHNNAGVQFRLSTMLITVTMTFLVLSAPNVILICIRHKYFDFSVQINDLRDIAVYRLVAMVTNFCLYLNHAVNFFLYCISGERFRRELVNLFRRSRRRRPTWSMGFSDVTTRTLNLSESSAASPVSVRRIEEDV